MTIRGPAVRQLKKLLYWMEERQRIYLARQRGAPWPWTRDPILQRFRFCNTYREQDRVTKWIRENWRDSYPQCNDKNLWFAMCVARHINWPGTLAEIGYPSDWNPRQVLRVLEKRQVAGRKVYTSAYLLGGGCPGGMAKTRFTVMGVLNPLWRAVATGNSVPPWENPTAIVVGVQDVFKWLCTFFGFGKFLAYEVATDLRWTRYLKRAHDIYSWANIGPGAVRGLNRLYERELRQSHPQPQLLEELLLVQTEIRNRCNPLILPDIEARDIEHSLCEYDKYERVKERMTAGRITGLERFVQPGFDFERREGV